MKHFIVFSLVLVLKSKIDSENNWPIFFKIKKKFSFLNDPERFSEFFTLSTYQYKLVVVGIKDTW